MISVIYFNRALPSAIFQLISASTLMFGVYEFGQHLFTPMTRLLGVHDDSNITDRLSTLAMIGVGRVRVKQLRYEYDHDPA